MVAKISPPITSAPYGDHDSRHDHLVPHVANPLTERMHKGINTTADEGQTPIVVHQRQDPCTSDIAFAHDANSPPPNVIAFDETQITHPENRSQPNDQSPTLAEGARPPAVAFKPSHYTRDKDGAPSSVSPTLSAEADKGDQDTVLHQSMVVRRLTPLECERLQGFPDFYTDIPGASDTGRYKALGNSMAVPVMRWIGERIEAVRQSM